MESVLLYRLDELPFDPRTVREAFGRVDDCIVFQTGLCPVEAELRREGLPPVFGRLLTGLKGISFRGLSVASLTFAAEFQREFGIALGAFDGSGHFSEVIDDWDASQVHAAARGESVKKKQR